MPARRAVRAQRKDEFIGQAIRISNRYLRTLLGHIAERAPDGGLILTEMDEGWVADGAADALTLFAETHDQTQRNSGKPGIRYITLGAIPLALVNMIPRNQFKAPLLR
jgi:hypothetical protein